MNKIILIFVCLCSLFLGSCDKMFVDVSGFDAKLQGKWQLQSIKDDVTIYDVDTIYYNFQNNLFQYQVYFKEDSMLCFFGYYTLYSDTAVYLELMSTGASVNNKVYTGPLNVMNWDMTGSDSLGNDTVARYFRIKELKKGKLNLVHQNEEYFFQKF